MANPIRISLLLLVAVITCCQSANHREGFYAIAHMTHTKHTIQLAMKTGANALEADLNFDKTTAKPTRFYHGPPCDCSCYKPIRWFKYNKNSDNLCLAQRDPCNSAGQYEDVFNEMLNYPQQLALIYIDCKISGFNDLQRRKAANQTILMLEKSLFKKGYQGKVLIGSGSDKYMLRELVKYARDSVFKSRIYFSLDWNKVETKDKGIRDTLTFMTSLPTHNIVYAQGHHACHFSKYDDVIRIAGVNKANGVVSKVIAWTIDLTSSYTKYHSLGAGGIITNRIGAIMRWVRENNIKLARPGDDSLMPAQNKQPMLDLKCDCDYKWRWFHSGGCKVSSAAPPNTACQCHRRWDHFGLSCYGVVVYCRHKNSRYCSRPDESKESCHLGGGNCKGY